MVRHPARSRAVPYALGAILITALIAALFLKEQAKPTAAATVGDPSVASAGSGQPEAAPPDLSTMTPRERFDRLYNRVMQASEAGDTATVARFSPMAIAAYGMLEQVDADARYHLALLQVHLGNPAAAKALADSILAQTPSHLFGFMIRSTLARWSKSDAELAAARAAFRANYDAEIRAGRPEYQDHQSAIDRFRKDTAP